jgi:hypothetical protein
MGRLRLLVRVSLMFSLLLVAALAAIATTMELETFKWVAAVRGVT